MGLASPQTHPRRGGEIPRGAPLIVVDLNHLILCSLVHLRGSPSGGGGDHKPQPEATSQLSIQFQEKGSTADKCYLLPPKKKGAAYFQRRKQGGNY